MIKPNQYLIQCTKCKNLHKLHVIIWIKSKPICIGCYKNKGRYIDDYNT